jgi:uncharacterized small protein (DUF1192 family)
MKKYAAAIVLLLLTACATKKADENDVPSLVPPPETSSAAASNAASDARLAEMQTSMTELLERIDVLNARIARLEAAPQSETRVAAQPLPRVVEPAPRAAVETAPAPRTMPAAVSGPLQNAAIADNYRGALILFGKGRMADARTALQ